MGKMKRKTALIFGITGQDGSYLAELLLKKNYIIHGVKRRSSSANTERIDHIFDSFDFSNKNFFIHYGDISDGTSTLNIINKIKPNEIYNLAAQSHVRVSFDIPEYTADITALGALRILEAIKILKLKKTKYYQASSSEMYGLVKNRKSLNEKTPFHPRSVYGISKVFAYHATVHYREAYGIFASNGILFNHESPRRGPTFVTRKITRGLNMILKGERDTLVLGNLDAKRDWGHAKDYVEGMWRMLQVDTPDDYVLSTNEFHSVREFVEIAFKMKGFDIKWRGIGIDEVGYDANTNRDLIFVSEKYFRPAEVEELLGDSTKVRTLLGWKPEITFEKLVEEMVNLDCK